MKKNVVASAVAASIFLTTTALFASGVSWQDISRGNTRLKAVLIDPQDLRIIYLGSARGISKSEDFGSSWRSIFFAWGQRKAVNMLLFDPQNRNSVYAATDNGLYVSDDSGGNWRRIFQGRNYLERQCSALAITPGTLYLGTKAGLFTSTDKGSSWQKGNGNVGKCPILNIVSNRACVYVASSEGVFGIKGHDWERIFLAETTEEGDTEEENIDDQDEEIESSSMRYLAVDPNNTNHLYVATSRGVYESFNAGESWEMLPDNGLLSKDVEFLLISPRSEIYAISNSRVFRYSLNRWEELSSGLTAGEINFLALDSQNNLYAACDKGLFKANMQYFTNDKYQNSLGTSSGDEPDISDVQRVAIKYAEVEPEKIKRWRKQAAKKAWFPQVSTSVGRNVSDLWHWESGSSTKAGDDVLVKGRDALEWDVSLSWDLSKIIWNEDQTSIDVRSRLTVQLRDDIIDEVNKTYFERLRVKMELDNLPIEDRKKRNEKELRLRELTASLDGLTGGYFSHNIKPK